jgi:hypothetical protein
MVDVRGKRMKENGHSNELPSRERTTWEQHSFDELAQGLANGALSRRRVLKMMGGLVLGGLFASQVSRVAEAQQTCPNNPRSAPNPCFVPCGNPAQGCGCVRTTEHTTVCAETDRGCPDPENPNSLPRACRTSADCPAQFVCADVEKLGCCPQNVCVRRCA